MELLIRGKHIFGNSQTKAEMIECLMDFKGLIENIPDEAEIENKEDDYIFFTLHPKDKDDTKYLKRLGFKWPEDEHGDF